MRDPDFFALNLALLLIGWGVVVSWIVVGDRLTRRQPLLALAPRRRVPWTGAAVGLVFVLMIANQLAAISLARRWMPEPAVALDAPRKTPSLKELGIPVDDDESPPAPLELPPEDALSTPGPAAHPLVQFLTAQHGARWAVWLAAGVGVLIAPLVEEMLFRVLLQGWLEGRELSWRRRWPSLAALPRGAVAIALPAAIFASLHFRQGPPEEDPGSLGPLLVGNAAAGLVTFLVAALLVWMRYGARPIDLGLSLAHLPGDVVRGLVALGAVLVPVYVVQIAAGTILQRFDIAADPLPLFVLACVLGYLFFRTHRIWPSLVVHIGLNTIGLLGAWLHARGSTAPF